VKAEIGMPLQICLNCSGRLFPAIDTIAATKFLLSDNWLSAISYICSASPIEDINKAYFCLKPLKTIFEI
jgi:hypothetical protein